MPDSPMGGGLIPLASATVEGAQVQTVDARELHAFLDVGRDFTNWIKCRIAVFGFVEGADFVSEVYASSGEKGGRPSREFHLTLDMAKQLAMVERTERGRQARRYFIECERLAIDGKPLAALDDPETLRGLLARYADRAQAASEAVEGMAAKVDAFDRIAAASGSLCRTDAAKALQVQPKILIDHMRKHGWTFVRSGSTDDMAFQSKLSAGLLEHKARVIGMGGRQVEDAGAGPRHAQGPRPPEPRAAAASRRLTPRVLPPA